MSHFPDCWPSRTHRGRNNADHQSLKSTLGSEASTGVAVSYCIIWCHTHLILSLRVTRDEHHLTQSEELSLARITNAKSNASLALEYYTTIHPSGPREVSVSWERWVTEEAWGVGGC